MEEFTTAIIFTNLLIATKWTLILSVIAFICGGLIGSVVMLMRISPNKWLSSISWVYIEFLQGTPLLLQLFLAFFGISIVLGVNLSPLQAATLALTALNSALVCVTHEVGFAREVASRVIFLADGMLVEDTTPTEFFNLPKEERTKKFLAQILH